jgi:hypothetical protein
MRLPIVAILRDYVASIQWAIDHECNSGTGLGWISSGCHFPLFTKKSVLVYTRMLFFLFSIQNFERVYTTCAFLVIPKT